MISPLRNLLALMNGRERRQYALLCALMGCVGLFEAAGVASVLPFLAVVADPTIVAQNPFLSALSEWLSLSGEAFLFVLGLLALTLLLAALGVRALATYAIHRFSQMRNFAIGTRLLTKTLQKPYAHFLSRHSADLATNLLSEVEMSACAGISASLRMVAQGTVFVAVVAVVVAVNPVAALSAALVVALAYLSITIVTRRAAGPVARGRAAANTARFKAVQEAMGAIKDFKVLSLEAECLKRFKAPARRYAERQARFQILAELPRFALEGIAFGGMIVFLLTLLAARDGGVVAALPDLGLLALAGIKLLPAAQQIYLAVSQLRHHAPAVKALLAEHEAVLAAPQPEEISPKLSGAIAFQNVSYTFDDAEAPAVKSLSLNVPEGAVFALAGTTGSGKTTVLDLLLGLLTPDSGTILIGGVPLTAGNAKAFRQSVGYVSQTIALIDGTIEENIALGVAPEAIDRAALTRAVHLAALEDLVAERGLDAPVGERGVRLSGGQRQRIGLARALYRAPSLLVLDEATSALDPRTERAVMENLRAQNLTIMMVAHRPATLAAADTVVVLENGALARTDATPAADVEAAE